MELTLNTEVSFSGGLKEKGLNPNLKFELGIWFCSSVDEENDEIIFLTDSEIVAADSFDNFSVFKRVNFNLFITRGNRNVNIHFTHVINIQKCLHLTDCDFEDIFKSFISEFTGEGVDLLPYIEKKLLERLVPFVSISKHGDGKVILFSLDPLCGSNLNIRKFDDNNDEISWIFAD